MTDIFSLKVEEIVSKIKDAQLTSVEQDVRERRIDDDHFRTTWPLDGARVLIIDDVVTSGTTLSAAATALRAAGAIVVDAFTLANAQPGLHYCLRLERG